MQRFFIIEKGKLKGIFNSWDDLPPKEGIYANSRLITTEVPYKHKPKEKKPKSKRWLYQDVLEY